MCNIALKGVSCVIAEDLRSQVVDITNSRASRNGDNSIAGLSSSLRVIPMITLKLKSIKPESRQSPVDMLVNKYP